MIRVWLGPLPEWTDKWLEHVKVLKPYGWDFLLLNDRDDFLARCEKTFGFAVNPQPGTRKACEYDPAYGEMFADLIDGYDFWGHCNLDCVYGRLDRWLTESYLKNCDVFGNDPGAICGPFSIYRNEKRINGLYRITPNWREIFLDKEFHGFDEGAFSRIVSVVPSVRFKSAFWQSHDKQWGHHDRPQMTLKLDGSLYDRVKHEEVMMFHFNRSRQWPIS
jgi:hypothetical protein